MWHDLSGIFFELGTGPVGYNTWNDGEPNNFAEEECVEIDIPSGGWNDLRCDSETRAYVCELPIEEAPPAPTLMPTPGKWTRFRCSALGFAYFKCEVR